MSKKNVAPVLKWVGGKRQILSRIEPYIPSFQTYIEPFLGGGAVLFHIEPSHAKVNDVNSELINVYQVIKTNVEELIEDLRRHLNDKEYFYQLRSLDKDRAQYDTMTPVQKASRMLYLNKTCYNGLFRVNKAGEFNTPFGKYKNPNIVNEETLKAVSAFFNESNITFYNQDFEYVMNMADENSFVYLDPPYDPVSTSANFTSYDKGGFNRPEQIRLKEACDELNKRGVKFLLSNAATVFIKELYAEYNLEIIQANRAVNSRGDKRGAVEEVLVRNYD